jgi:IclR family transcriptional regulator, KDG regulon repressor
VDAINKAFEILELFLHSDEDLSVNDVSERTQITYPTAHRITSILVKRGYLFHPERRGKYSVHPAILVDYIGIIKKKLNIRSIASPFLHDLSQNTNEAVFLTVRRGQIAINIDSVNRSRFINITPETSALGLYCTGSGKVLLSYLSDKELKDYFNNLNLIYRTPNTIKDKDELMKQIIDVRRNGVAYDDEETELGLRSVAAPIRDWEGKVVAAISIIGPVARINKQRLGELANITRDYGLRISQAMGARS